MRALQRVNQSALGDAAQDHQQHVEEQDELQVAGCVGSPVCTERSNKRLDRGIRFCLGRASCACCACVVGLDTALLNATLHCAYSIVTDSVLKLLCKFKGTGNSL